MHRLRVPDQNGGASDAATKVSRSWSSGESPTATNPGAQVPRPPVFDEELSGPLNPPPLRRARKVLGRRLVAALPAAGCAPHVWLAVPSVRPEPSVLQERAETRYIIKARVGLVAQPFRQVMSLWLAVGSCFYARRSILLQNFVQFLVFSLYFFFLNGGATSHYTATLAR